MMIYIIVITFLSIIASGIGTISGFGLGTLMTPLLLLFLPFTQTILVIGIIHWFHDVWKILFYHTSISWRIVIGLGITGIIGSIFGSLIVGYVPEVLTAVLGAFLIIYVIFLLLRPTFNIAYTTATLFIGGIGSGFFAGLFGIRGAMRGAMLTTFNLTKETYIGTLGAIGILTDTTRLITYWATGIYLDTWLWWGLLFFIPASFIGAWIGQFLVGKIPQHQFRTIVAVFLLIVGIWLMIRQLFLS